MNNYELCCYKIIDENNKEFCYGWKKFESEKDIYTFVGWLISVISYQIKFNMLEYFQPYYDFETYLNKILENNGLIAKFSSIDNKVKYEIYVKQVDR